MKLKKPDKALLIVDFQNDFCPGGALAVAGADKIIPTVNKYLAFFLAKNNYRYFFPATGIPRKAGILKNLEGSGQCIVCNELRVLLFIPD